MWMGTGPKLGELQNPTSGFSEDGKGLFDDFVNPLERGGLRFPVCFNLLR